MASAVIHLVVANEINKQLSLNNYQLLIGSIAPDISKLVGETKLYSHFLDNIDNNVPNIDKFLDKYKNKLNDPFVMGYFIHLYTDLLWFKYFITEITTDNTISTLDGKTIKCSKDDMLYYIYNDYTNINEFLIKKYNIDKSIFYKKVDICENIIDEIPMNKLDILINKTNEIILNNYAKKCYVFDTKNIVQFINTSINLIELKLKELNLL